MGERAQPQRVKFWACPDCGARLGVIAYERGKPPELIPAMPVIAIRGGVAYLRCLDCEALSEWRMPRAA